jgi:hypothetical protein
VWKQERWWSRGGRESNVYVRWRSSEQGSCRPEAGCPVKDENGRVFSTDAGVTGKRATCPGYVDLARVRFRGLSAE